MNPLGGGRTIGGVLGRAQGAAAGNGLLAGLVAYWALNEASGNAIDLHSGGLTLTQTNDPGSDTGKIYATARSFVAANAEYFYRTPDAALQLGDIDFAMAAWFFQPIAQTGVIFSQWREDSPGYRSFRLLALSTSNITFAVSGDGATSASATVAAAANAWHLAIAWHDAIANKIYLQIDNGALAEAAHSTGAYVNATAQYRIGAQNQGTGAIITGKIGPVAMWKNRTLDATARAALWNGGSGLAYSALS